MISNNRLWTNDIDIVLKNHPELSKMSGKTIIVTGATGLICSAIVDVIMRYNEVFDGSTKVIAAGRSKERVISRFSEYYGKGFLQFIEFDSSVITPSLEVNADYIIHGASIANPLQYTKFPVETLLSNFYGLKSLLDCSKNGAVNRLLYISSSEIYGRKTNDNPYEEDEYGYIDLLNPRNSYSMGKRVSETLCATYASEYKTNYVIVRPGHVYGPTASQNDNRVSSAWAFQAARGEDIVMKSDGHQLRSYCYCLDCASAILYVLLNGEHGHAYNISNPDSVITIKKLGEILAQVGGVSLKMELPKVAEARAFNPMDNSSLNATSLLKLGWKGLFDAEIGLSHTVEILRELFFHNNRNSTL